jgi:lysophospholipase L1-like esterase
MASRLFLRAIDVQGSAIGTVVAFGDSITDGYMSGIDAQARWPDVLARRLAAAGIPLAVANAGISGNLLTETSVAQGANPAPGGPRGVDRFAVDALALAGTKTVVVLEGINDIGLGTGGSSAIISGLQQLIAAAHQAGVQIIGGTITPAGGDAAYNYGTAAGEATRQAVNAFVRSGAFDGVADFDAALRDPADPTRLAAAYDSGDHLHPNAAGYAAMANAFDLTLLAR